MAAQLGTKEKKTAAAAKARCYRSSITCLNDSRVSVLLKRKGDSAILRVWSPWLRSFSLRRAVPRRASDTARPQRGASKNKTLTEVEYDEWNEWKEKKEEKRKKAIWEREKAFDGTREYRRLTRDKGCERERIFSRPCCPFPLPVEHYYTFN